MSLQTKVIALLLGVFAVYGIVEYGVQRHVLLPSFVALEREGATRNLERVLEALEREVELLAPSARDWGTWSDTYQFVADRNAEYLEANLNVKALEGLNVSLLAFYDQAGSRVWGLAYDHATETELALGELSAQTLRRDHPLLGSAGSEDPLGGLIQTDGGLFVTASSPILTSEGKGPSRGRVVLGRLLDDTAIARLGQQARVELSAERLAGTTAGALSGAPEHSGAIPHTAITLEEPTSGETPAVTRATTTVMDLTGTPVLRLRVDTPRAIVAQGRATLNAASLSLILAGAGVLLVLLVSLRRTVLGPLATLTAHATAIGRQDDSSARLSLRRRDELGVLAGEFNRMLERLAETRQRLLDQSYRSGVAEMASGVLHNIGNAITPLGVKLTSLKRDLQQAPCAELDQASAELADPHTAPERRADLTRFMELAAAELAALLRRTQGELDAIRGHVDHIQLILADQQRFTRAQRVIEPLALQPLVEEAVRLLPEELRRSVTLELDPALGQAPRVLAARVALQQVITNLLINAAEAVRASGQRADTGRIRVSADPGLAGGLEGVHLCVEDNGVGIGAEDLGRVFDRDFSTKARGSGMGLHWSANTISALGGRLDAESAGLGLGARFHLRLPRADSATQPLEHAA